MNTHTENPIQSSFPWPGPSAAKLRLVEDELKATKEALEQMIIERDQLQAERDLIFQQRHECVEHIVALEYHIGEQNRVMNEMSATLIKLGDQTEGE